MLLFQDPLPLALSLGKKAQDTQALTANHHLATNTVGFREDHPWSRRKPTVLAYSQDIERSIQEAIGSQQDHLQETARHTTFRRPCLSI